MMEALHNDRINLGIKNKQGSYADVCKDNKDFKYFGNHVYDMSENKKKSIFGDKIISFKTKGNGCIFKHHVVISKKVNDCSYNVNNNICVEKYR